jgi:hypothetical protein
MEKSGKLICQFIDMVHILFCAIRWSEEIRNPVSEFHTVFEGPTDIHNSVQLEIIQNLSNSLPFDVMGEVRKRI